VSEEFEVTGVSGNGSFLLISRAHSPLCTFDIFNLPVSSRPRFMERSLPPIPFSYNLPAESPPRDFLDPQSEFLFDLLFRASALDVGEILLIISVHFSSPVGVQSVSFPSVPAYMSKTFLTDPSWINLVWSLGVPCHAPSPLFFSVSFVGSVIVHNLQRTRRFPYGPHTPPTTCFWSWACFPLICLLYAVLSLL